MDDANDVKTPRELHPAFYGCFDWHSAVHGHWMLVKLMKEFPDLPERDLIIHKINKNLTPENMAVEVAYFSEPTNRSFERTYGWAWLLKLADELYTWNDPVGQKWFSLIQPLADSIAEKYLEFLPKLTYPNRTGEHPNTAFGLGFAWDYAKAVQQDELLKLIASRSRDFYKNDVDCPANYEPGGFGFISPCLMEADLMARILDTEELNEWLPLFLPGIFDGQQIKLFEPATVTDRSDGKLVHLDGLNLSRVWCLNRIAKHYPQKNEKILLAAQKHLEVTLPNISSGEYSGEHWLASFAVYAMFSGEE